MTTKVNLSHNARMEKLKNEVRTETMKRRLLDATLDVIVSDGWAATSTPKICRTAEVSRGAQTHHFPTKAALLHAALDHLARDYEAMIQESMGKLPAGRRTLRQVLDVIWKSCLDDRFMFPSMEALVAARTDDTLNEAMTSLDQNAVNSVRSLASGITEPRAEADQLADVIEMSLYYFRGLVVQRGLQPDSRLQNKLFEDWCQIVEHALN